MNDLLIEDHDRVRHLTLNRPAKRNALTLDMCRRIVEIVEAAEADSNIGCTLLAAAGSAFCSGMDLIEHAPVDQLLAAHEQLFTIGARTLKPIVIAVNGVALAGGLGLVAQGHVVLASPNAYFGLTELRVGFWPFIVNRSVEAAIGKRRTLHLALTGQLFGVTDALTWGLVHQLCPSAEILETAVAVARGIAKSSPLAIASGMQYRQDTEGKSHLEASRIAGAARAKLMASADFREGTAAFKQKREPRWPSMPPEFYAEPQGSDS